METQLVRLDAPYNLICSSTGKIGTHIATLIVVKEKKEDLIEGARMSSHLIVCSYPVVGGEFDIEGNVWLDSELKDCLLITRQKSTLSLYTLRRLMEYCSKHLNPLRLRSMPLILQMVIMDNDCKFVLPKNHSEITIRDYDVCLEFEESRDGEYCMVFTNNNSDFFFYEYFNINKDATTSNLATSEKAISGIVQLKDSYIGILSNYGLNSIKFSTRNKDYQWFVDKVNQNIV